MSPKQKWMRVADTIRRPVIFFYEKENFTLMWSVILSLRKLLQSAMHWQNRLFLTLESLTLHLFFLSMYYYVIYKQKCMQWRRWSARMALRDINKKRRRNRWASKQVSWRYISLKINKKCIFFSIQTNHNKPMHILFQNYFDNLSQ